MIDELIEKIFLKFSSKDIMDYYDDKDREFLRKEIASYALAALIDTSVAKEASKVLSNKEGKY